MGNGDIKEHKENESSVKEDLFEAIIGAVALDTNFNYDILEFVVNKMLNIDFYLEAGFDEKVGGRNQKSRSTSRNLGKISY